MSRFGPTDPAGDETDRDPKAPVWEQRVGHAAVALCEALVEAETSGGLAIVPETAKVIGAALKGVVHDEVERGDFLDQALALAEDIVARQRPEIDSLRRLGGRIAFRTLETWPGDLTGRPLQPFPSRDADPERRSAASVTGYEARSLHQAAHAYVGALLTDEPFTAAFGRFRFKRPIDEYQPAIRVRVLLAGAVLDLLVEHHAGTALSRLSCPCGSRAMQEIALASGVTARERETIGESVQRARMTTEVHDQFLAYWATTGPGQVPACV